MNKTNRERLFASTLLAGVASLGVPLAVGTVAVTAATDALAQDYSNANLTGQIVDDNGAPIEGASVTVTSDAQGFSRSSTTNANGQWRIPQIPQGSYTVVVSRDGYATTTSRDVRVQVGADNSYEIAMAAAGGAGGDEIVVTAQRQVEFSQTTTGASVDVSELVEREPIARNITALTLLAPTALPADTAFSVGSGQSLAPASVSGASGGENAFFINGLNITNFINGIGGATVPFDFYQTVEVKTGGYQAEFGRATGGVINAVTKSGSNDFMLALHGNYQPNSLLEDRPDAVTREYTQYDQEVTDGTVEFGGPILPDHLFIYGMANFSENENSTANRSNAFDNRTDDPFYGVKLDAYITDDHHFEATWFDTSADTFTDVFAYNAVTNTRGAQTQTQFLAQGGESYVGRYTGAFTDWLTLSGAYGRMEVNQATCNNLREHALVQDARTSSLPNLGAQAAAACGVPFLSEREFYRADVDVFFNLMGEHHVRFGLDSEETLLTEQSTRNGTVSSIGGPANWVARRAGANGNTGLGLAAFQQYLERRTFTSGGGFAGTSDAIYIQDSWDVTERLNLSVGWRRDQFSSATSFGDTFMEFDDEQALRVGFSYDTWGDRSGKLYGFFGRYYLPLPANTAFRIAAPATDISEFFLPFGGGLTFPDAFANPNDNASAFDPVTGMPLAGLGPTVTSTADPDGNGPLQGSAPDLQDCPNNPDIISAQGTIACFVRNSGTPTPPESLVARNLQSTYEDEYLIGFEQRINNDWTAGISLTYRNLGRVSEDALIDQGVIAYCAAHDLDDIGDVNDNGDTCQDIWDGTHAYFIVNPGNDATVLLGDQLPDGGADHIVGNEDDFLVTLAADDLQLGVIRREYLGLVMTLQRAFDGVWGMDASYTVSRSEGNFEGALKSDIGQTDAGITEDYDFLSFLPGQYGLLPNHRAHQLKIRGSYAVTEDFLVGGNLSVFSPRHYGCIGAAPADYANGEGGIANGAYGFQANARFCNGLVVDRGSSFTSDWLYRLDLSFRYDLPESIFSFGDLTLRADIFNVFNEQGEQENWEFGELSYGVPDARYGQAFAIQTPRSVRFGFDWQF